MDGRSVSAQFGADALLETLESVGCRHLFGLPGTTVGPLLDRLLAHPGIEYVLAKHESAAVAMAEGYARVTGAPAVVSLYMAVGLANGVSMIYNAHKSRVPLVVLACQQDLALRLGTETVVDGDQLHLVQGLSRYAAEVTRADRLREHLLRAYKLAAGPLVPGPTLLSIPRDVLLEPAGDAPLDPKHYRIPPRVEPLAEQIDEAAELLIEAKRPLVIAGSQVAAVDAIRDLVAFVDAIDAPVAYEHFFNDRIGFPRQHPCSIGHFRPSSPFVTDADVVLALGCRLHHELSVPERPRISPTSEVIQINRDPDQLAFKHPARIAILSDPGSGVRALHRAVKARADRLDEDARRARRASLLEHTRRTQHELEAMLAATVDDAPIKPWQVVHALDEVAGTRARVVTELSTNTNCFSEFYRFARPELVHGSSGCALGWGIAAAAGMKLADPAAPTVACVGDGAFLFGVQTLWTLANYRIAVVVVVFNNGGYYSTRLFTEQLGGLTRLTGHYAGGDMPDDPTDCAQIARGFGISAERVVDPGELRPALRRAVAADAPYVLDVAVSRDFRRLA